MTLEQLLDFLDDLLAVEPLNAGLLRTLARGHA
jgi:hypothetical protein